MKTSLHVKKTGSVPTDQRRCETGQSVEQFWINDGEWDCTDASDEYTQLSFFTEFALAEASRPDFANQSYVTLPICNQSHPFLCLSSNATEQGFSCFNLSQIGDGHIDCAGAMG